MTNNLIQLCQNQIGTSCVSHRRCRYGWW